MPKTHLTPRQELELRRLVESRDQDTGRYIPVHVRWRTASALETKGLASYAKDMEWLPTNAGVAWIERSKQPRQQQALSPRMEANLRRMVKSRTIMGDRGAVWCTTPTALGLVKRGLAVKASHGINLWYATDAGAAWVEANPQKGPTNA